MLRVVRTYQNLLTKHPVLIQGVQAGLLMGGGDLICQKFIEEKKKIEWKRTAQFTAVGFIIVGPVLRTWFGVLDRRIVGSGHKVALKKVACDQLLFAPNLLAVLLTTFNGLQGLSFEENIKKLKRDYPDVLLANYMLWPWIQIVNFWLVPLNYQVLVVQTICLIWNTYLSWKVNVTHKIQIKNA